MDALDLRILRTMGLRPFANWPPRPGGLKASEAAEVLDENVDLVRDRIRRMEESGLIQGYRVFPNMRLFGLQLASHHFTADPEEKRGVLDRLSAVDGVVGVYDYVSQDVCVDLSYRNAEQRDRRLSLIADLIQAEEGPFGFYERDFPDVDRELSPLDWRIVAAVRDRARRPLSEIADDVGVTPKTIRKRLGRLREEGSIDVYVDLDLTKAAGVVTFGFAFWFPPADHDEIVNRLLKLYDDYYLAAWKPPPNGLGTFDMDLFANSLAEMRELEDQATRVPGVDRVACLVPKGGFYNEDWIDELIQEMVTEAAA